MLIGQEHSGKTSLKKSLQGLRFNPKENSTIGIDVDPSHFKVTTDIWKPGKEDQSVNKEEMGTSFEHGVARVVVENLREQELTSEVKTIDKSKDPLKDAKIPELSPPISHSQVGLSADSLSTTQIETVEDYADSSAVAHADGRSRVFQTTDNYLPEKKARESNVSSGMIPKEMEKLIRELGDRVDKMESEDYLYSVLWDFAGESVYYETHQLFLTSRAVYLLVYDLSRDPDEIAQPLESKESLRKLKRSRVRKLTATI